MKKQLEFKKEVVSKLNAKNQNQKLSTIIPITTAIFTCFSHTESCSDASNCLEYCDWNKA